MAASLALWDVWTRIAGPPVAFEPPSAGFVLDWQLLAAVRRQGVEFATLTHAAGISSTGDPQLDAQLPFDEPYRIPDSTAALIRRTRASGGRIIAIGTTVVRALEDAACEDGTVRAGEGIARLRIGGATHLRVVDMILSGTHEPGTSHYELLHAFADPATLSRADRELQAHRYRTHEFGDSVLIAKRRGSCRVGAAGLELPMQAGLGRADTLPA
jgi:S-adenosylmethionine:tRNA ribosyltransferase-isomerase